MPMVIIVAVVLNGKRGMTRHLHFGLKRAADELVHTLYTRLGISIFKNTKLNV